MYDKAVYLLRHTLPTAPPPLLPKPESLKREEKYEVPQFLVQMGVGMRWQKLHSANLGDSGFMVIRNGRTLFKSPPQQQSFNFPYQLGSEGGNSPDQADVRTAFCLSASLPFCLSAILPFCPSATGLCRQNCSAGGMRRWYEHMGRRSQGRFTSFRNKWIGQMV